jgi:FSR family fosmidomycin resistance protein-like MFS transporter
MKAAILNEGNITKTVVNKTVFPILLTISFSHMLNDTIQSLIPSIYPLVKDNYKLSFSQVGLITFTFQLAASLLQPFVGFYTDKRPQPFSLALGMTFTLMGLVVISYAANFAVLLCAVALIGLGSSVFHPEASKVAFMASGGRRGLAQSIFQVGGNAGSALGPLLAALIIVPFGQTSVVWFSFLALLAIMILFIIGRWYQRNTHLIKSKAGSGNMGESSTLSQTRITVSIIILLVLIFSKFFYLACMSSYYTFFLIDKFNISVQSSQLYLFVFLAAVAAGTLLGGPLGDRFGRKYIIWFSVLGAAPFTLLLPYASLFWTSALSVCIGFILASAFPAILVYAQELIPGKLGMVSGLFFGFAFGMGGVGSALLGALADRTSIQYVFKACAFLPLIGLLTGLLPNIGGSRRVATTK